MFIFRVENHLKHGPIYGVKYKEKINIDISHMPYADALDETQWEEEIEHSYDSRQCIIAHKTPRENKPYFHNRYEEHTFKYYRFGMEYRFGYKNLNLCLNYVKPGIKNKWTLLKEGFFIAVYSINKNDCIFFPDGQIAFKYNKAKLIQKINKAFA